MTAYPPPVAQLLTLGEPSIKEEKWIDYASLGIRTEHVPDLIRVVTDPELIEASSESIQVWAPVHAWRALGQFRAVEAVAPLLHLLRQEEEHDSDWGLEELPTVFSMIGPPALPSLIDYFADPGNGVYSRGSAG